MLPPDIVLTEVPAMIAPEDNDGILALAELIQALQNTTNLSVGIRNTGGVVAPHLHRKFLISSQLGLE